MYNDFENEQPPNNHYETQQNILRIINILEKLEERVTNLEKKTMEELKPCHT